MHKNPSKCKIEIAIMLRKIPKIQVAWKSRENTTVLCCNFEFMWYEFSRFFSWNHKTVVFSRLFLWDEFWVFFLAKSQFESSRVHDFLCIFVHKYFSNSNLVLFFKKISQFSHIEHKTLQCYQLPSWSKCWPLWWYKPWFWQKNKTICQGNQSPYGTENVCPSYWRYPSHISEYHLDQFLQDGW